MIRKFLIAACCISIVTGCATPGKIGTIKESGATASLSAGSTPSPMETGREIRETVHNDDTLTVRGLNGEKLYLMKTFVDSTGNVYGSEELSGVVISTRSRNIAERGGKIDLAFDVLIPKELMDPTWQVRFRPLVKMMGQEMELDEILITGSGYRREQLKGYELYDRYLKSLVTDSTALRHQHLIEVFIERHLPSLGRLKGDSSSVDYSRVGLYDISYRQVVEHYLKRGKMRINDYRKGNTEEAFRRFVKVPIDTVGVRVDSVITHTNDIIYSYHETIEAIPQLRKLEILLPGEILKRGNPIYTIPSGEPISFYISNLATFAEKGENGSPLTYLEGIDAIYRKEYHRAATLLAPFRDINTAVAYMSQGENSLAREVLEDLPQSAKRDYMLAIIYAADGETQKAIQSYIDSVKGDHTYAFRANLDPEIRELIKKYNIDLNTNN